MSSIADKGTMVPTNDEWGGIDKNIEPVVRALNALDIPTSGSCEGHSDHGYPSPWISIRSKNDSHKDYEALRTRVSAFLDEFYAHRDVPPDIKISILDGHRGFSLHAASKKFIAYRTMFNERAVARGAGYAISDNVIDENEQASRRNSIPLMQSEFRAFGAFLISKAP